MRLAEALIEKKELQVRISDLLARYTAAAVVEQGETADETASDLLKSLSGAMDRMEELTVKINLTNNTVSVEAGTLMQAIAHRDNLKLKIGQYNAIVAAIRHRNQSRRHYGENTPKMVVTDGVDITMFTKLVDDLSKELRILDVSIQEANWSNDLN